MRVGLATYTWKDTEIFATVIQLVIVPGKVGKVAEQAEQIYTA